MSEIVSNLREKLVDAFTESDSIRRSERVERTLWLSSYQRPEGIMVGRLEPLRLMEEARVCYVDGHYIAVLLTAIAFIEHTLVDELEDRGIAGPRDALAKATATARAAALLSPELLERTDNLRVIRNCFAHRKPDEYKHGLGNRFRERREHPDAVLEADAQEAIHLMYAYFHATLKGA